MKFVSTIGRSAIVASLIAGLTVSATAQSTFQSALRSSDKATKHAEEVQVQINQLDDEQTRIASNYRQLLQTFRAKDLKARQDEQVVQSQRREIANLNEQLGRIDLLKARVVPMMQDMINDLKVFIQADLPFKHSQRLARVERLEAIMVNPNVTEAERYRQIISAYQQEMEYGRTIQTWEETIDLEGKPTTVDMFLYGRVAYVYITTDDKKGAIWDRDSKSWEKIPGNYIQDIRKGIRVAEGKAQQDVLFAPVKKFAVTAAKTNAE